MNKKLIAASALAILLVLPIVSLAAFDPGNVPVTNPNMSVIGIIDLVISFVWPVLVILIIVLFIVGLFSAASGDPEKVGQARQFFIWALVGTVVVFLAWSIPFIVRNAFGL